MDKTLFLSTVTGEFGVFRNRFARFLERLKRFAVRHQDDFFQTGEKTLQKLEAEVAKSDLVIHLIGETPGWSPPPDQVAAFLKDHPEFTTRYPVVAESARRGELSATQWEAWLALVLGKTLISFEFPARSAKSPAQLRHVAQLKQYDHFTKQLEDDETLLEEVFGSLVERGWLDRADVERKTAPSRITKHSPQKLFGREKWLDALDAAWGNPNLHVYTLVAWGGVGKTSLVAHWVTQRMEARGWPGVKRYFDWSFYSQGTGESRQTSSDLFIQTALTFFGDPDPTKGSPWDRGERLAEFVKQHRTLLVLDGIEPLQYPPNDPSGQAGRLKDQALQALLQSLAADNLGLCIVTTREHLKDLDNHTTTGEQDLDELPKEAAIDLLRHLQIVGTDEELTKAIEAARGHALTLQLLGRFIADAYPDRHVDHFHEVKFDDAEEDRQGRSAFKVMIAYERWFESAGPERQRELVVLRLTGLFERPMSRDCLQALRAEPAIPGLTDAIVSLREAQWNIALKRLSDIDLLTVTAESIDAHPLIREYFAKQLRKTQPEAFRAAHSRLFDHLCETTEYRPDTLAGLQPLYEAVAHGCLAGRQQEACEKVYRERILRGTGSDGYFSSRKLGAIGVDLPAVAAFFDEPWNRVSPNLHEVAQAWSLSVAAFSLRALGRLTEALEPMRASMERRIQQENWQNASINAMNLSELELTLGRIAEALADARQSITFADQSGAAFYRMVARATTAMVLHISGHCDEAGALFVAAELLQRERQKKCDLLYSVAGFRYCDWLLAAVERAAWRTQFSFGSISGTTVPMPAVDWQAICSNVELRGKKSYELQTPNKSLLWIALDQLTLARVGLLRAILSQAGPQHTLELPHVADALNGLRQAGQIDQLPRGLLTAALYHFVRDEPVLTRARLDEAQQIAERGPMPLHLADVHLHRARMFRDRDELAKARELIVKHGYGRRYDELADAEQALG